MITGSFFIPNLITPNGDGSNDVFEVVSIPRYSVLRIFNRWGDRVYYSTDYNNSFSGESLSDGVYYYELELRSGQRFKGWVEVLR
jgi:gliding motility-associated-like protein